MINISKIKKETIESNKAGFIRIFTEVTSTTKIGGKGTSTRIDSTQSAKLVKVLYNSISKRIMFILDTDEVITLNGYDLKTIKNVDDDKGVIYEFSKHVITTPNNIGNLNIENIETELLVDVVVHVTYD